MRPVLRSTMVRLAGSASPRLASSRQIARESLLHGAVQKPSEFAPLLSLVRAARPATIVEIGSAAGGTLHGFSRCARPDAVLVSIDVAELPVPPRARRRQVIHTICGDSHEEKTARLLRGRLQGRPIDVLFIDGDHSYDGVSRDFELYGGLVRPGGIVAFHDILVHPQRPEYEVHRLWSELRRECDASCREFVDPAVDWGWGQWGGIGVVVVEDDVQRLIARRARRSV